MIDRPRFAQINLSQIAPPAALDAWTFDAIIDARMADLKARLASAGVPYDVGALDSDPGRSHQRVDAYREGLVRQRVNDAVEATFLLRARGADLDVRAAEYHTLRAAGEGDESLRLRAWLAWEALSLGGSYGGYEYFARSAAPTDIADVAIYGHEVEGVDKGEVRIMVLGASGRGATPPAVLGKIAAQFDRTRRKVNDLIVVRAATVHAYTIDATLVLPRGADAEAVRQSKLQRATAYAAARARIAGDVTYGGVVGAIGDDDPRVVARVELRAPFAAPIDPANEPVIGGDPFGAPICTSIRIATRAE